MQYTSPAAQRYRKELEKEVAKLKNTAKEQIPEAPKSAMQPQEANPAAASSSELPEASYAPDSLEPEASMAQAEASASNGETATAASALPPAAPGVHPLLLICQAGLPLSKSSSLAQGAHGHGSCSTAGSLMLNLMHCNDKSTELG